MIGAVSNIITNPILVNIAQSTNGTVICKTSVNAIGRPGFILIDSDISEKTKKFAAMKEFLYQASCLAVYMAIIVPIFKKGGFKLAKEKIFKNTHGFEHFKNLKEYTCYRKLADNPSKENRLVSLEKNVIHHNRKVKDMYNSEIVAELSKEKPDKFNYVKGAVELGNIIGSVTGLAIIAPQVSQKLTHPILSVLGLEEKQNTKENKKEQSKQENLNTETK